MSAGLQPVPKVRFSVFELDQKAGELHKNGSKLRIEGQPLQILALLLEQPGKLVTREELRRKLWAPETNVDFEHGINTGVRRLRDALGDCAETPRFIETLPRRGYRFIYPLSREAVAVLVPRRSRTRAAGFLTAAAILVLTATSVSIYYSRRAHVIPKISSLAVLPLVDVSGDASQEYFADGMTDELITNVSKIPDLRVISRTSVMRYKETSKANKGLAAIARELKVDGIIEGTVLRSGNRVRITVQLIHGSTDTHLWAETYEGALNDVMALQDEVTQAVARQVKAALTRSQEKQIVHKRSIDPGAYGLYLKGRHYFNNRMAEKAAASFSEAIKLQPDFAEAYAGLGDSLNFYELANAARPEVAIAQGKAASLRALEIDDSLAEAHSGLAWAKMVYDWDWAGAEAEFRRAVALNPNYETAHLWYGCELIWEKRFDEGLAEMKRAQEVTPADPFITAFFGMGLYQARQYKNAAEELKVALDLDGANSAAHEWLGFAFLAMGKQDEAVAELEKGVHFSKDQHVRESAALSRLGYMYGITGRRKRAEVILAELQRMSIRKHLPATDFAVVYIGLGDKDSAFTWLNKAYEEHAVELALINADPRFDPLRSDPRLKELIRRMRFPEN